MPSVTPVLVIAGATLAPLAAAVPIANNDFYTPDSTRFEVSSSEGILTNDTGSDPLRVILITNSTDNGSVSVFGNGRFVYTPDRGASTNDSFTYRIRDASGGTAEATVTLDLESTLPTAVNDNYTVDATTFTVNAAAGILNNDTGGIGNLQTILITDSVDNGSISVFGPGNFTYTPDYGADTNDSFSYRIRDELGRTSEATVILDLESTLPTAVDDLYLVDATNFVVSAASGILANDTGGIGDLQTILITDSVDNGSLLVFGPGNFSYTPDYGADTNDSFTYRIRDALGRTADATVILDLESSLPVSVNDLMATAVEEALRFNIADLVANDLGGFAGLTFLEFGEIFNGELSDEGNGWYVFNPADGFNGLAQVGYSVIDGLGRVSSSILGFQVGSDNPNSVPVPGTPLLLLAGLAMLRLRKRRAAE
jgi:hypothetical protein